MKNNCQLLWTEFSFCVENARSIRDSTYFNVQY